MSRCVVVGSSGKQRARGNLVKYHFTCVFGGTVVDEDEHNYCPILAHPLIRNEDAVPRAHPVLFC